MNTPFVAEVGKVFEVIGGPIGAFAAYTEPPRDENGVPKTAPEGGQYRGESTDQRYQLQIGDRLQVIEIVTRVEDGYGSRKAYEVVRGTVVTVGGEETTDENKYYFWPVYEGKAQLRAVVDEPPPPPLPPEPTDTEIEVKAGQTVVLDVLATPADERVMAAVPEGPPLRLVKVTLHALPLAGAVVRVLHKDNTWLTEGGTHQPRRFVTGQDGRVWVPYQDEDLIYVESPGGFSCGLKVGDSLTVQATLNLPWTLRCSQQYPEEVRLVPGYDTNNWRPGLEQPVHPSGWANHAQQFLEALTSAATTLTVSLGRSGRLLCRFNPPLKPVSGLPLIRLTEDGPREGFQVRLGRALQDAGDHLDPPGDEVSLAPEVPVIELRRNEEQDRSPRVGVTRLISYPRDRLLEAGSYSWVEIRDLGDSLEGQPAALPGLDVTGVVGCRGTIDGLALVVDSSGSMTDNEGGEFSGKEVAASPEDRIYRKAIEAILAPVGLLPPRDDHGIDLTFVGLYGNASKSDWDLADNVEVPIRNSNDRDAVRAAIQQYGEASDAREFTHYTPLRAALEAGAGALRTLPNERQRRVMVVITDGDGTYLVDPDKTVKVEQRLDKTEAASINPGTAAVLELIGFRVPKAERRAFLDFGKDRGPWLVAPHFISNSDELLHLLGNLRIKYGL